MENPFSVAVSDPLKPFATRFACALLRQGYRRQSARIQIKLFAQLSAWLADVRLEPSELSSTHVARFLVARRRAGATRYVSPKALCAILTYLRDEGVVRVPVPGAVVGPVEKTLDGYREYLTRERGLVATTARLYLYLVRPFVLTRVASDGLTIDWATLRAADVIDFVVAHTPQQRRGVAKLTVTALRSFLGFLHVDGRIARSLTGAVPSVAGWRLAGLPKGLTLSAVRALLRSCDRRRASGRRDFAILTMLVRLGLRAGEVAALRLDDIEWRRGTLVVRGKG
jgi:hypothetical protein